VTVVVQHTLDVATVFVVACEVCTVCTSSGCTGSSCVKQTHVCGAVHACFELANNTACALLLGHCIDVTELQQSAIKAARGGDSGNIISKLIEALSDLEQRKVEMKAATDASVDAANKCQADKVSILYYNTSVGIIAERDFCLLKCSVSRLLQQRCVRL
jgi:hypothetical protein